MNMDFYADVYSHRNAKEELYQTPWWQALMADPRFYAAYDQNDRARLLMSEPVYVKRLLHSEAARQQFIEDVFHPEPVSESHTIPDEV